MARRGRMAAGFWMIKRQNENSIDSDFPIYSIYGNELLYGIGMISTKMLFLTNDFCEKLTLSGNALLSVAMTDSFLLVIE